jgi:hypothetical protein
MTTEFDCPLVIAPTHITRFIRDQCQLVSIGGIDARFAMSSNLFIVIELNKKCDFCVFARGGEARIAWR